MALTAAIKRGSFCNDNSVRVCSVVIFFGDANVTCLPAVRTIIQPVHAKSNIVLRLAEATIPLAGALRLGFITLRANNCHLGDLLFLPHLFHPIVGQEGTRDKQLCPCVLLAQ